MRYSNDPSPIRRSASRRRRLNRSLLAKRLCQTLTFLVAFLACAAILPAAGATEQGGASELARQIFKATGVEGGLIVHVGCGDGTLTAALRAGDGFVVQGLEMDPAHVAEARKNIQALGLYGPVSATSWDGRQLPYAENMVNLLVVGGGARVSTAEMLRVLAPLGVAYVEHEGKWTKSVKPWPKEIDEWTHWLHDAGNNAVARDTRVGPPQRMQWVAGPLWSRGHEVISSVGAAVTARGRILYAVDEGQPGVYTLPSKWVVAARNAFNGVLLWKRPLPDWDPPVLLGGHDWGFEPRRFTTDGDRLYLPLGADAVLTALDAATGRTVKSLPAARGVTDILVADGILLAVLSPRVKGKATSATLVAARPATLDVLWTARAPGLVARTAAIGAGRVCFCAGDALVALDAATGKEKWRTAPGKVKIRAWGGNSVGALVIHEATVYCQAGGELLALAADSGKPRWRSDGGKGRGAMTDGLFVADGLLWRFQGDAAVVGHDLSTGKVCRTIDPSQVFSRGHHPRCYPGKATERYVIANNRGAEFLSLTSPDLTCNDWLRGNCGFGVMPANGLLYAPPNQCFCYGGIMLTGFKALAAGPVPAPADPAEDRNRLERGPAYGEVQGQAGGKAQDEDEWPMYRHDVGRLGPRRRACRPRSIRFGSARSAAA